ncbi:MAG: UDP-3-O-(3-hydroxymyristoyl)glucosamine N-acyltransferase [Alphaproteobacteria bacterium]
MADPDFFLKSKSFSVSEMLETLKDKVKIECPESDKAADIILDDVCALKDAQNNHLSFLDNIKYKNDFTQTRAGACFVSPEMIKHAPDDVICLITKSPYKAYALAAQTFYPTKKPQTQTHSTSVIEDSASIGANAYIGANVYIGHNVEIGDNVWIEANATVADSVKLGAHCHIGANASISHAILHDHVRLYPGARIGQDGFGFAIDPAGHVKVPQLGRVIIEDHVEIGANTTIDRGAGPDTIIGTGTWIDNLVQIGHNVQIGRGCIIVAHVGISGSTQIGDFVAIGGQAGIAGHLKIGTAVRIGAQSGIMHDLPPMTEYMGTPGVPKTQFFRQVATLNRLIKKKKSA